MRVLLTTDTIGGVWTFTRELGEGLLRTGHDVALVSFGRFPSPVQAAWCEEMQAAHGGRFRYKATDVPLEWMEDNAGAFGDGETVLLQTVCEFEADVVHANQFCFGALPMRVPKVVTAHSDVLSWGEACQPDGLAESDWLRRYRALVEDGLAGADVVAAPTRWMADALRRGFALDGEVRVISNGRTLADGGFQESRRLQTVSVGRRWDPAKNLEVLEGLELAMPVVIAGETRMGDGGALGEEDVLALFRRSSVYLAAAIYEPFGLAALEAALCGCAVVANDIPSLREVWGEAAIYFNGRESLRQVLARLAEDAEGLRAAQLRSRTRALQFSAGKMVGAYVALYGELMEGAAGHAMSEMAGYAR